MMVFKKGLWDGVQSIWTGVQILFQKGGDDGNKLLTLFENKQASSTYYWSCDRQDVLLIFLHWPVIHTAVQMFLKNPYLWYISKIRTNRWNFHLKETNQNQDHILKNGNQDKDQHTES